MLSSQKFKSPKFAITGFGGMGKTQIALEMAYWTKKDIPNARCYKIPATSVEGLQQAFTDIGQQLGIPRIREEQAKAKKLVQSHLSRENAGQWLLIIDNVDDMEIWNHELKDYLPKSQQGWVMCTTRSRKVAVKIAAAANIIELSQMDAQMAPQLLSKSINQEIMSGRQDVLQLLEQLTFLPLAIVQAASSINANGILLKDCLSLLNKQEKDVIDLLSEGFEDEGSYANAKSPVATTGSYLLKDLATRPSCSWIPLVHVVLSSQEHSAVASSARTVPTERDDCNRDAECVFFC